MIAKIKHNVDIINIVPLIRQHKDFLPQMFFDKLSALLNGDTFQWFFNKSNLDHTKSPFIKNNKFMFTHTLFREEQGKSSGWFNTFEPILYSINEKVKVTQLIRMKLNLYTNQNKKINQGSHYDHYDEKGKPSTDVHTALLNFTTCNGGTKIDKKIYKSKANEILIFNNTSTHNGIVQTDTVTRIVLNINWK